jgi:AraC-like DNA-binding protein
MDHHNTLPPTLDLADGRVCQIAADIRRLRAGALLGAQAHPVHEVIYVVAGAYRACVADADITCGPGGAVCYPAGTLHRAAGAADGRTRTLILQWRPTRGERFPTKPVCVHDTGGRLLYLLQRMMDLTPPMGAAAHALREALLDAFLLEYALYLEAYAPVPQDPIARALHEMEALVSPAGTTPLQEMAALVGLSPSHFGRLFRARTGTPPIQYLQRLRVRAALPLILSTELPLAAVAARVGLGSASYLCRLVARHCGRAPSELRAEAQGRRRGASVQRARD